MIERIIEPPNHSRANDQIPKVITWKGEKMIRNQSVRATVDEILKMSAILDVVKINIVGNPSTGKTTLSEVICHLCHKMSAERKGIPYTIKFFDKNDLFDLKSSLSKLSQTNYVIVFEDVSFLESIGGRKKMEEVKQAFTEIRHLKNEDGTERGSVKIIVIFNFHYLRGLTKYLRSSEFSYYTSIGSEETENLETIVGRKYRYLIEDYKRIWQQAYTKNRFTWRLGKKNFVYPMRNPFAPLLFWNNQSFRFIVSPKRDWIDSICNICAETPKTKQTELNLDDFMKDLESKHTLGTAKSALKIMLLQQSGINTYSTRTVQAMRFIDKYLEKREINLEDLALKFDLTPTNAHLLPCKQPEIMEIKS